jgi:hypothetical protein
MGLGGIRTALQISVKRHFLALAVLGMSIAPLHSATLERLSLDDMVSRSTSIVRGKVTQSWAAFSGPVIYTHYRIEISERFKGPVQPAVEIVVPGGVANGLRQSFSGAPALATGQDYVLFLWTGRTGLTQVIGLTQGLFTVGADDTLDPLARRPASRELMLDPKDGKPVKDETLEMRVSALRSRIASTLAAKGQQ